MAVDHNIGIQMEKKELAKAFMMISNWKYSFGLHVFYKLIQLFKGLVLAGMPGLVCGTDLSTLALLGIRHLLEVVSLPSQTRGHIVVQTSHQSPPCKAKRQ